MTVKRFELKYYDVINSMTPLIGNYTIMQIAEFVASNPRYEYFIIGANLNIATVPYVESIRFFRLNDSTGESVLIAEIKEKSVLSFYPSVMLDEDSIRLISAIMTELAVKNIASA